MAERSDLPNDASGETALWLMERPCHQTIRRWRHAQSGMAMRTGDLDGDGKSDLICAMTPAEKPRSG